MCRGAKQGVALSFHELAERGSRPGPFGDNAAVQSVIADFPRLAVGLLSWQRFAELRAERPAAPDHGPEERFETQRTERRGHGNGNESRLQVGARRGPGERETASGNTISTTLL